MTKLKVGMISLGCNKNRVDSETALGLLREHGYELTNDPAQADVLMVNTCGFIASAKEESIDAILDMARYKQIGKCRVLVVTGCLAQRYEKDLMQEIPEIDLLMGVNQYQQLPDALEKALGGVRKSYCMDDLLCPRPRADHPVLHRVHPHRRGLLELLHVLRDSENPRPVPLPPRSRHPPRN